MQARTGGVEASWPLKALGRHSVSKQLSKRVSLCPCQRLGQGRHSALSALRQPAPRSLTAAPPCCWLCLQQGAATRPPVPLDQRLALECCAHHLHPASVHSTHSAHSTGSESLLHWQPRPGRSDWGALAEAGASGGREADLKPPTAAWAHSCALHAVIGTLPPTPRPPPTLPTPAAHVQAAHVKCVSASGAPEGLPEWPALRRPKRPDNSLACAYTHACTHLRVHAWVHPRYLK